MVHPDDTAKTFAYDALDRMIAETNELGHTTKRAYDAYGNLVAVTDPVGGTTQYLFGENESEAPSTTPNSALPNPHSAARRLTGIISPAGRRIVFLPRRPRPPHRPNRGARHPRSRHLQDGIRDLNSC